MRYDARLSKARTIAERKRRRDSGAVISVRRVIARPRAGHAPAVVRLMAPSSGFSAETMSALVRGVQSETQFPGLLEQGLANLCAEARENDQSFEEIIAALKEAYGERTAGDSSYDAALLHVLSLYFERA